MFLLGSCSTWAAAFSAKISLFVATFISHFDLEESHDGSLTGSFFTLSRRYDLQGQASARLSGRGGGDRNTMSRTDE